MNYQVGDKVRIKGIEWYDRNKDKDGFVSVSGTIPFNEEMSQYCGNVLIISDVEYDCYLFRNIPYAWTDEMIECKVEE